MATGYQLTQTAANILRMTDNAFIPNDPSNADWQTYQAWLAAGNTPMPAPTVSNPTVISNAAYMARFMAAEQTALQNYTLTHSTTGTTIVLAAQTGGATYAWLWTVAVGPSVDLSASATASAHAALVSAGILTQARSTAILTP